MTSSDIPPTDLTRPTVLLVDDSRVMRKAMHKILGDEFELIDAEDGEIGWEKLTSHPEIVAVISDIEMPNLDGYEFMTRIRGFEDIRIRNIPIIIITGAEDEETRLAALEMGATDFITKPFDQAQLLARTRAQAKFTETARDLEETTISLAEDSTQDPLTGLKSRRFFLDRGEQDVAYNLRHGQDMTVLRVDIDNFRQLYSAHGDEAVDKILIWFSKTLVKHSRFEDTIARIGGSSFAIMAPSTNRDEAIVFAERLRTGVSNKPYTKDGLSVTMTASIGLATLNNHPNTDIENLLKIANDNLRLARRGGGDAFKIEDTDSADAVPVIVDSDDTSATLKEDGLQLNVDDVKDLDLLASEELVLGNDINPSDDLAAPDFGAVESTSSTKDSSEIESHLWSLLKPLLPLLEYCDDKLNLGISEATKTIRQRIENSGRK